MPRYTRDNVMYAKAETTYGTDAVPTGAANAILLRAMNYKLSANNVSRDLIRNFFGASEQLVGTKYCELDYEVELVGGGAAGSAPAWDALILSAGMAKTIEATIRVNYLPLTNSQGSVSAYAYRSGVLNKVLGARSKLSLSMKQGEIPVMKYQTMGLYGGVSAASPSGVSFTGFQAPQVVTNTNSTQLVIGGTVNATGAPVITGGTPYPSLGLEIDLGMDVPFTPLVGGESIDVTNRQVSGKLTLDVTAAQEVSLEASVLANTLQSIAFLHGTTAGKKVLVYLPTVQFINPTDTDLNGRLLKTYDLVGVPTTAGNDELQIILF